MLFINETLNLAKALILTLNLELNILRILISRESFKLCIYLFLPLLRPLLTREHAVFVLPAVTAAIPQQQP